MDTLRSFIYFPATFFDSSILPASERKNKYINGRVCYGTNQGQVSYCQLRGSCLSHVDVMIFRNLCYPQIYDTSGIYLQISWKFVLFYSFTKHNSYVLGFYQGKFWRRGLIQNIIFHLWTCVFCLMVEWNYRKKNCWELNKWIQCVQMLCLSGFKSLWLTNAVGWCYITLLTIPFLRLQLHGHNV